MYEIIADGALLAVNIDSLSTKSAVKVIGANGQISLGKEFAGRQVLIEETEPGVWLIRTAKVIPENELWLHQPRAKKDLQQAIDWAVHNQPRQSDPLKVSKKLSNANNLKRSAR